MNGILSGLRIVEGSAFVAAPLGGMTLAQLGADVIRFDQIGGGLDYRRWPVTASGVSLYWADLNKGKRSIAVDLRSEEGREILTALITAPGPDGGIFLTHFPDRKWLAYETLKQHRADLIKLTITGDRGGGTAVDYTVNARVGLPFMTGTHPDEEPVNHVLPAWDVITGQMAAVGLLAAERHRMRSGQGQHIELALADVALATMGNLAYLSELFVNDADRQRHGNHLFGAFGRDFETKDGRRVMIVGITPRQWAALKAATGLGPDIDRVAAEAGLDFSREGDRFTARHAISALFAAWIGARDYAAVAERFDSERVCWGPYQTVRELAESDPAVQQSGLFDRITQPNIGDYLAPNIPLRFTNSENLAAKPAPMLGANTEEILADLLGYGSGAIGRLVDEGVVAVG